AALALLPDRAEPSLATALLRGLPDPPARTPAVEKKKREGRKSSPALPPGPCPDLGDENAKESPGPPRRGEVAGHLGFFALRSRRKDPQVDLRQDEGHDAAVADRQVQRLRAVHGPDRSRSLVTPRRSGRAQHARAAGRGPARTEFRRHLSAREQEGEPALRADDLDVAALARAGRERGSELPRLLA